MGEIAAMATSLCWTFSSTLFTIVGRQVGPLVVNRIRLIFAVFLLAVIHFFLTGQLLPLQAEPFRWFWLGLSGILGLALGDSVLYLAYIWIGNRLGMLLLSSSPVLSGLAAWLLLGETLRFWDVFGMILCLLGIVMVVLERQNGPGNPGRQENRQYFLGVLAGLASAVCQAAGLILAKKGLSGGFPAISGTVIRMLAAMIALWGISLVIGQAKATLQTAASSPGILRLIAAGTVFGPVMGVWFSLVAVQYAPVGIAATLSSLTPIFLLPVAKWWYKERVSGRAVFWTVIALSGVAVLLLM